MNDNQAESPSLSIGDSTRFRGVGRQPARWVLAGFVVFSALCVYISLSPHRIAFYDREKKPSDLELYWAEVQRIADGQRYYEAAAIELSSRGYPTQSPFNFRMPLPMWLLGVLPQPEIGGWILAGLAATLLIAGVVVMRRESNVVSALLLGIFLGGAVIPCMVPILYVEPLLWSGTLMALSLMAFAFQRPAASVAFGIAALFFRDFAGWYCLIMAISAARRQRRAECLGWVAGIIAFGLFFVWHTAQVTRFAGEQDVADVSAWMQWNGLPAVIAMSQMNGFLLLLPQWVAAIFLSAALLGFASWHTSLGRHMSLTVVGYLIVFSIVGKEVNQYWGSLFAPLLCFGAARAPSALRDLFRASR